MPAEARILVHQIWPGGKRYDASAETYTAEEMVRIQRDVGRIARYTVDMGGDIELFELAMRIPPWEKLRALTAPELRRMRLQTSDAVAEAPTSGVAATGRPAQPAPPGQPARAAERGWMVAGPSPGDGRLAALLRSHALTIEGDEVGRFELALACADNPAAYRLSLPGDPHHRRRRGFGRTPEGRVRVDCGRAHGARSGIVAAARERSSCSRSRAA